MVNKWYMYDEFNGKESLNGSTSDCKWYYMVSYSNLYGNYMMNGNLPSENGGKW